MRKIVIVTIAMSVCLAVSWASVRSEHEHSNTTAGLTKAEVAKVIPETKEDPLAVANALEILQLPADFSANDLRRVIEARSLSLSDSASWEQIYIAREDRYYQESARKLRLDPTAPRIEIAKALVDADRRHQAINLGLPENASQKDIDAANGKLRAMLQALQDEYNKKAAKATIEESAKLFKELLTKQTKLLPPEPHDQDQVEISQDRDHDCIILAQRILKTANTNPIELRVKLRRVLQAVPKQLGDWHHIDTESNVEMLRHF